MWSFGKWTAAAQNVALVPVEIQRGTETWCSGNQMSVLTWYEVAWPSTESHWCRLKSEAPSAEARGDQATTSGLPAESKCSPTPGLPGPPPPTGPTTPNLFLCRWSLTTAVKTLNELFQHVSSNYSAGFHFICLKETFSRLQLKVMPEVSEMEECTPTAGL